MKPIKASEAAPDPAAAEPQSFSDSLKAIDTSSLDRLIEIRKESVRIAEYRAKADEKKSEVAEAVYARVSQDYAKRAAALEAQSAPLRTQARAEYRKLKALVDALGARQEQAQMQKDELQFRHTVGELNDGELAARLVDPQRILDQCASDRKEVDASKARFVEALGSEEALDAPEPAAPQPPVAQPAPPAPAPQVGAPAMAAASSNPAAPVAPAPPAAAPKPAVDEDGGETRVVHPPAELGDVARMVPGRATPPSRTAAPAASAAAQNTPAPASAPRPAQTPDNASDGATVMLATAAIVVEGGSGKDYPLTVLNGIGRAEDNRICLSNPGISRKHAVITAVAGGFMIKDLGSQNGTFVNGQRVTERKLAEGDIIDVGSVKFVFRSPWPPRAGASAARGEAAAQGKR